MAVNTIPEEFYAGANPVVKFKEVEKVVSLNKEDKTLLSSEEKRAFEKVDAAGGRTKLHPANLLTNRKFLIIGGVILFTVIILGTGTYYWWESKKSETGQPQPASSVTEVTAPEVTPPAPPTEPIVTPAIPEVTPPALPQPEALIELPSVLLGESVDTDHDNISDVAEELFKTDPFNSDTDGDKYPDGHELYYLYNPAGFEPIKLIDSGLIQDFTNPTYGYKVYFPITWAMGNVDANYQQVLFSTLTGENIEVHEFDLEPNQNIADWLAQAVPQEKISDLVDFSSYFKVSGKKRIDGLVYYFKDGQHLYVLTYHTTDSFIVNYKIVLEIMARSFRLGEAAAAPVVSSPQPPLLPEFLNSETSPPAVSATGTEEIEETEEIIEEAVPNL